MKRMETSDVRSAAGQNRAIPQRREMQEMRAINPAPAQT